MTPDAFDALLAGLVLGFALCLVLWLLCGRRKPLHERIREHLLALAQDVAAKLPEPDDREIAEMMIDARLAANRRVPYALYVLTLGQTLLRTRRRSTSNRPDPPKRPAN